MNEMIIILDSNNACNRSLALFFSHYVLFVYDMFHFFQWMKEEAVIFVYVNKFDLQAK